MTITQLRKQLDKVEAAGADPDKTTVLLSSDPEGNGFGPANDIDMGNWSPKRNEYTSHPDDIGSLKKNAICIWPR